MKYLDLSGTVHNFEKQNLVTLSDRSGSYDIMRCSICGIKGKRRRLMTIEFTNKTSSIKIEKCSLKNGNRTDSDKGERVVEVIKCSAFGRAFGNLTPGSKHLEIDPPKGATGARGVWVMGVGEPVLLLTGEFQFV